MPLPLPDVSREAIHTRNIRVQAYSRSDGLWDLDAELQDVKAYDFPLHDGMTRHAGEPVHDITLRVTIDDEFNIVAAVAAYEAAPYGSQCSAIAPDYQKLVGLNLLKQFRHRVKERFHRAAGCSHLTELSYVLPTVAIQTMAGKRRKQREAESNHTDKQPFQLDGCHALRLSGPVVKEYYPVWYRKAETKGVS